VINQRSILQIPLISLQSKILAINGGLLNAHDNLCRI